MVDQPHPDALEQLADFAAGLTLDRLPAAVRSAAATLIADSVAVMAAGMQVEQMRAFADARLAQSAPGHACVIGTGRRAAPDTAAFLNGTAATWLELNEGNLYANGHPGIQVVPAALAAAQALNAGGEALLCAVVAGYEIAARIGRACRMQPQVHPHGTWGVAGATIGVGRLRGLDAVMLRNALSMAGTLGLATSRNTLLEGATVRNLFTGHSGAMGWMSVDAALAGFTGERDGVAQVFGRVVGTALDAAQLVRGLGDEWLIETGYHKLYPTGRYIHATLDALEQALGDTMIGAAAVARIEVRAFARAAQLAGQSVVSSFGARFSVPFALATRLWHGHAGLAAFADESVANPAIQALAARIHVTEHAPYTAAYPGKQPCDVAVHLRDGRTLRGQCEVMRGERENPHPREALETKFMSLGSVAWGEERAAELYRFLHAIEASPDVQRFPFDP